MLTRFPVEVNGQWHEAEIDFALEREVRFLARWQLPRLLPQDAAVERRMRDAIEFARLASNRWRYYRKQNSAVENLAQLQSVVTKSHLAEIAMVMVARPAWDSATHTLGIAYLRRTWCNHLFLEFFTSHPRVLDRRHERVRGVGNAMLHQILALAEKLEVPCIWGEATESSHSWYEQHLDIEHVRDHFFIEDSVMQHGLNEMRMAQGKMLARRVMRQDI